ncbi:MAG: phosphate acyltransferase PlsX [Chloroflexi bacterium]|nr:phosphate acyltransferase PlsX [Chloroflexota bacterium]
MRIALDAMGSDHFPQPDVEGAVRAARRYGHEIVLVGRREAIEAELAKHDTAGLHLTIAHATEMVTMGEHPSQAVRAKPDASIVVGMGLLRDGQVDALVSAGNSGGVLAATLASKGRIGRIPGIKRPAISTVLPNMQGFSFVLDIGANTDAKPEWLAQYAVMGRAYARHVLGIAEPRLALLSNGEEKIKGNQLVQDTHALLDRLGVETIGNVEGKDLVRGLADVIVTDGFVGNVAIKTAEGVAGMLLTLIKQEIKSGPLSMLGGLLARPALKRVAKVLDFREYGGAPLLGVNGVVIIGHGRSDAVAVENMVRVAAEAVQNDLVAHVRDDVAATLTGLEQGEDA